MRTKTTLTSLIILMICGVLYFAPHGSMQKQKMLKPTALADVSKFALLIGINRYKEFKPETRKIRDLQGTNNDVELMKNLLVKEYSFGNVKTLLNEQATQKGILDGFRSQLIENAKNYQTRNKVEAKDGATVVFYYSGHGSQLRDDNGDETDGIDETLVAHDSDSEGIKDIRDDEFDKFFNELRQYTTNITFIFDSCHSGTVTRGGNSRSVRRDLKLTNNSRGDGGINDGIDMKRNESYVAISGSLPSQLSQENEFTNPETSKTQWDGDLTYSLVNHLRQNPDATYREIMTQVQNQVVAYGRNQTPQFEGDVDRAFFGSSATRGRIPILLDGEPKIVKKTVDGQEISVNVIKLKVGTIVGAGDGAAIAVYWRNPKDNVKKQIGSGVIVAAEEFSSTAEVDLLNKEMKEVPSDATVLLISPSFSKGDKRVVALDFPASNSKGSDTSLETMNGIESKLEGNAMVKTVRQPNLLASFNQNNSKGVSADDWKVAIVRGTYKDFKFGNEQPDIKEIENGSKGESAPCSQKRYVDGKEPLDTEQGFFISDRIGKPLYNLWYSATDNNAAECLADAVEKYARIENLRNLTSGGSDLNDGLKVELVRLKSFTLESRRPPKCSSEPVSEEEFLKDQTSTPQLKAGDNFYLNITNNTQKNLFLYIYSLATNGEIQLLYQPEESTEDKNLLRGKTFNTLEKLNPGSCGAFFIEPLEKSPPGIETLKIIAVTEKFPGKLLEQPSIAKNSRSGSPLNHLLMQAATGTRTGKRDFKVSDWATKNFSFEIVR